MLQAQVGLLPKPSFAVAEVTATASGNTAVVAAVSGRRIRVIWEKVIGPTEIDVKFQSDTTDISSDHPIASRGGWALNAYPGYIRQTAVGEALNVNLSAETLGGVSVEVGYETEETA